MNLGGDTLRELANFYKVPSENIIIIYDDIDIPIGAIKFVNLVVQEHITV